jgi:hypothetical protein
MKFAGDQGDADGQCGYAECLEKGVGVVKNIASAAAYYKRQQAKVIPQAAWIFTLCGSAMTGRRTGTRINSLSLRLFVCKPLHEYGSVQ